MSMVYTAAIAVTPSNSATLRPTAGVYVGAAGTLSVVMAPNGTTASFTVPAGTTLPISVKQVIATGTSASGIVALY